MKIAHKILLEVLLIFIALFTFGCAASQEKISQNTATLIKKAEISIVPEKSNADYYSNSVYTTGQGSDYFVFEYAYDKQYLNPKTTLLYFVSEGRKTKITELTGEDAWVAFAKPNTKALYWTNTNKEVFRYVFETEKIEIIPIKCDTTFSLTDDFLLFLDADTGKIETLNLKTNEIEQYGLALENPYWVPPLTENLFHHIVQEKGTLKIFSIDLSNGGKSKQIVLKDYEINEEIISVDGNRKWKALTCISNPAEYTSYCTYLVNAENKEVTKLKKTTAETIFISTDTLLLLCEDGCYTYNIPSKEYIALQDTLSRNVSSVLRMGSVVQFVSNDVVDIENGATTLLIADIVKTSL